MGNITYTVVAIAESEKTVGYRMSYVPAISENEAIGIALNIFDKVEPDKKFSKFSATPITIEKLTEVGDNNFVSRDDFNILKAAAYTIIEHVEAQLQYMDMTKDHGDLERNMRESVKRFHQTIMNLHGENND